MAENKTVGEKNRTVPELERLSYGGNIWNVLYGADTGGRIDGWKCKSIIRN